MLGKALHVLRARAVVVALRQGADLGEVLPVKRRVIEPLATEMVVLMLVKANIAAGIVESRALCGKNGDSAVILTAPGKRIGKGQIGGGEAAIKADIAEMRQSARPAGDCRIAPWPKPSNIGRSPGPPCAASS